jgi:hypothetical protein
MRRFALMLLLVALGACNGGETGSPTAPRVCPSDAGGSYAWIINNTTCGTRTGGSVNSTFDAASCVLTVDLSTPEAQAAGHHNILTAHLSLGTAELAVSNPGACDSTDSGVIRVLGGSQTVFVMQRKSKNGCCGGEYIINLSH